MTTAHGQCCSALPFATHHCVNQRTWICIQVARPRPTATEWKAVILWNAKVNRCLDLELLNVPLCVTTAGHRLMGHQLMSVQQFHLNVLATCIILSFIVLEVSFWIVTAASVRLLINYPLKLLYPEFEICILLHNIAQHSAWYRIALF